MSLEKSLERNSLSLGGNNLTFCGQTFISCGNWRIFDFRFEICLRKNSEFGEKSLRLNENGLLCLESKNWHKEDTR